MATNKGNDRTVVVAPHATAATVGSLLLKHGQFGLYDTSNGNEDGAIPVTSLVGKRTDEKKYVIRFGKNQTPASRSRSEKPTATPTFSLDEVVEVYAGAPKTDTASVDEVIFGYNGVDEKTAYRLTNQGDRILMKLQVSGRPIENLGIKGGVATVNQYIQTDNCPASLMPVCDECDPCEEVDCVAPTMAAIEYLKKQPIAGGVLVGDLVDITLIKECTTSPQGAQETDMNFFCIDVCDTGDDNALALLQTQYPDLKIVRVARRGSTSSYKVIKTGNVPAAYTQRLASIIKGCEDCPSGYSEVEGGLVYAITLEDEGADLTVNIEELPGLVDDTAKRITGQAGGQGLYTAVLEAKLTAADIEAFLDENPTATISFLAETSAMCSNPTVRTVSWTACGSCKVSTEDYVITVPDDKCGNSRLADLQRFYPKLTIAANGNPKACTHSFKTTVATSNMVCDECDDIFKDMYTSEPPANFEGIKWQRATAALSGYSGCKCGIRFRGKPYKFDPGICFVSDIAYTEDSVQLAVSGGYPDEIREGISIWSKPIHTECRSRWAPRTHLGANLMEADDNSFGYFNQYNKHTDRMHRAFMSEETQLENAVQYADISITLKTHSVQGDFGHVKPALNNFHFLVEYGAHEGVVDFANMLAAAAGIKPCQL